MTIFSEPPPIHVEGHPDAEPDVVVPGEGDDIAVGSPIYNELVQFLYEEAALLDHHKVGEWSTLLAEDLTYRAPIRLTKNLADMHNSVSPTISHFDDNYLSMMGRIGRLTETKSAWSEDPPSRTRRFITNILAKHTAAPDEFEVVSYLYVARSRYENPVYSVVTAERTDLLRRDGKKFKIARRIILVDQSTLGMSNFAIFL